MELDRTELEWKYSPLDFFEAPYQYVEPDFEVKIEGGAALAVLAHPTTSETEARVRSLVENIFLIRQLQLHRSYTMKGPTVSKYSSGRKDTFIELGSANLTMKSGTVDFTLTDPVGNVVRDSKTERVAEDTSLLNSLAPKLDRSPTLRDLVISYSNSINDPDDELTHLYEIRDAISRHYGSETAARKALAISKTEWQRIGILANVEPLKQGRHRGKNDHRRQATAEELDEARRLVKQWIVDFARTLP